MHNLILIKLGGSIITDKNIPYKVKKSTLKRLCVEIARARKQIKDNTNFVLGNGGGSFSHPVAAKYQVHKGFINDKSLEGFYRTADAELKINSIVMKNLIDVGLPVISFTPRSFILAKNNKVSRVFLESIRKALIHGVVPVVCGDMLVDEICGCMAFSTEKALCTIATRLNSEFGKVTIINCGKTDGVYDDKGKTITNINTRSFNTFKKYITGSGGIDVTGGMMHKVKESLDLSSKYKIPTIIMNGQRKGDLFRTILQKKVRATTIS